MNVSDADREPAAGCGAATADVVIADRNSAAREGLHALLGPSARWRVRAEFDHVAPECGDPCVAMDAVLIAAAEPELLYAPDLVRGLSARVRLLVAFEAADAARMWRALELGAHGVIAKDSRLADWLAALDAVTRGDRYLPMHLLRRASSS